MSLTVNCPVENTLRYIGKKWTINIIRDLFFGNKRFKDFLKANPDLSTRMLSMRLKEMESNGIIQRKIVNENPVIVEYQLTDKGRSLNKIMYELAVYSVEHCPDEIFKNEDYNKEEVYRIIKETFY